MTSLAAYAAPQEKADVKISGFEFNPKMVTVKKGGSVTFTNEDSAPHTVTPEKDAHFEATGRMLKNESKTVTFTEAGTQHYFCNIHPSMKGTVKVVE
jgi:plastocyanin